MIKDGIYILFGAGGCLTGPKLSIKNVVIGCAVICYLSLLGVLPYVLCIMAVLSVGILPMLIIYGSAIRHQSLSGVLTFYLVLSVRVAPARPALCALYYGSAIRHQPLSAFPGLRDIRPSMAKKKTGKGPSK